MKAQDKKNLNTFGASTNNVPMKYPKIPAVIANTFQEYGSAEGIIKHIFLYLLRHYQSFDLATFLGQKWIEIDPETLADEIEISSSHLLKKTINCRHPYLSYVYHETAFEKGLPLEVTLWDESHKALFKKIDQSKKTPYDTVLMDALYRMWKQRIEIKKMTDHTIKEKWDKNYSLDGFWIVDQINISTQKVAGSNKKAISVKVKLSDKLIEQTLLFFTLIQPEEYKKLLIESKGHPEPANLYTYVSNLRNIHFFGQIPKAQEEPYITSFWLLCEKANLKYKKEPGDKDNWRYKEARKSITAKLNKMVNAGLILQFEIEKANATNKPVKVSLWFNPSREEEEATVAEFLQQRLNICKQIWMTIIYREQLKPGFHPWDQSVTKPSDIIEKYFNQEYYTQWLANKNLHEKEKRKAMVIARIETFPNTQPSESTINKDLEEFYQVGKKNLEANQLTLIKTNTHAKNLNAFKEAFKITYKAYFTYDYIEEITENTELVKWDLKLLYTFFACEQFKKKTISEFVKSIGYLQTKVNVYTKGECYDRFTTFEASYYRIIIGADSNLLCNLDGDLKKIILEIINRLDFKQNEIHIELDFRYSLPHLIPSEDNGEVGNMIQNIKTVCERVNELTKKRIYLQVFYYTLKQYEPPQVKRRFGREPIQCINGLIKTYEEKTFVIG